MSMEFLLRNDFTAHYGLPTCTTPDLIIQTNELYFEIEDTASQEIQLHIAKNQGMAKFSNPDGLGITIANYDKFLSNQDHTFQLGKKRCDILVTCDDGKGYFILGELKDRIIDKAKKQNQVKKGAKEQLRQTLKTIIVVPNILAYINTKSQKRCCYFNKQSTAPAPISAVSAFNRLANLFTQGFKMSNPDIEAMNFEYWEYTGDQTLRMTN
jgi:hypothetical protein